MQAAFFHPGAGRQIELTQGLVIPGYADRDRLAGAGRQVPPGKDEFQRARPGQLPAQSGTGAGVPGEGAFLGFLGGGPTAQEFNALLVVARLHLSRLAGHRGQVEHLSEVRPMSVPGLTAAREKRQGKNEWEGEGYRVEMTLLSRRLPCGFRHRLPPSMRSTAPVV